MWRIKDQLMEEQKQLRNSIVLVVFLFLPIMDVASVENLTALNYHV